MINEIKLGDKAYCLDCGKEFELTDKTFKLSWDCENIICPHCGSKHDVQDYHAKGTLVQQENIGEIEHCTITIPAPEVGCPYKVGDKFITAIPDFNKPRLLAEDFLKVTELIVEEVDLSNEKFPRLYCKDSNGKPVTVEYRFAPHFTTLEEAEREIEEYNQNLQKKIDECIAKYGQDKFDQMQEPLKPPFGTGNLS